MLWQDGIITTGQVCFIIAQLINIKRPEKPPIVTSIIAASWLLAFAPVFATLGLWWSATSTLVGGINWAILAWQGRRKP